MAEQTCHKRKIQGTTSESNHKSGRHKLLYPSKKHSCWSRVVLELYPGVYCSTTAVAGMLQSFSLEYTAVLLQYSRRGVSVTVLKPWGVLATAHHSTRLQSTKLQRGLDCLAAIICWLVFNVVLLCLTVLQFRLIQHWEVLEGSLGLAIFL